MPEIAKLPVSTASSAEAPKPKPSPAILAAQQLQEAGVPEVPYKDLRLTHLERKKLTEQIQKLIGGALDDLRQFVQYTYDRELSIPETVTFQLNNLILLWLTSRAHLSNKDSKESNLLPNLREWVVQHFFADLLAKDASAPSEKEGDRELAHRETSSFTYLIEATDVAKSMHQLRMDSRNSGEVDALVYEEQGMFLYAILREMVDDPLGKNPFGVWEIANPEEAKLVSGTPFVRENPQKPGEFQKLKRNAKLLINLHDLMYFHLDVDLHFLPNPSALAMDCYQMRMQYDKAAVERKQDWVMAPRNVALRQEALQLHTSERSGRFHRIFGKQRNECAAAISFVNDAHSAQEQWTAVHDADNSTLLTGAVIPAHFRFVALPPMAVASSDSRIDPAVKRNQPQNVLMRCSHYAFDGQSQRDTLLNIWHIFECQMTKELSEIPNNTATPRNNKVILPVTVADDGPSEATKAILRKQIHREIQAVGEINQNQVAFIADCVGRAITNISKALQEARKGFPKVETTAFSMSAQDLLNVARLFAVDGAVGHNVHSFNDTLGVNLISAPGGDSDSSKAHRLVVEEFIQQARAMEKMNSFSDLEQADSAAELVFVEQFVAKYPETCTALRNWMIPAIQFSRSDMKAGNLANVSEKAPVVPVLSMAAGPMRNLLTTIGDVVMKEVMQAVHPDAMLSHLCAVGRVSAEGVFQPASLSQHIQRILERRKKLKDSVFSESNWSGAITFDTTRFTDGDTLVMKEVRAALPPVELFQTAMADSTLRTGAGKGGILGTTEAMRPTGNADSDEMELVLSLSSRATDTQMKMTGAVGLTVEEKKFLAAVSASEDAEYQKVANKHLSKLARYQMFSTRIITLLLARVMAIE